MCEYKMVVKGVFVHDILLCLTEDGIKLDYIEVEY